MFTAEEIRKRLEKVFGKRQVEVLAEVLADAYGEMSRASDFGEVRQLLEGLAEAQARTEERLGELARAQEKTEIRVRELAEAQARTEEALAKLARQVGGLSETVGGDIEDIAYIVLHDVLKREFGWEVGVLERSWQTWDGEPEEVNVLGEAKDPGEPGRRIWIVGEAKHNLTLKEVERFIGQLERARRHLVGEIFPVCFCYRARPEVQAMVQQAGIRLVYSYGKLV